MEDAAIAPKVFRVFKQVSLVGGHIDRDAFGNSAPIALALVTVMVRVEDSVHADDSDLAEELQNMARAKIDEQRPISILKNINVARVAQQVEIGRNLSQSAAGNKANRDLIGHRNWIGGDSSCKPRCQQASPCVLEEIAPVNSFFA